MYYLIYTSSITSLFMYLLGILCLFAKNLGVLFFEESKIYV